MPTFAFYRASKPIHGFVGADTKRLQTDYAKLLSGGTNRPSAPNMIFTLRFEILMTSPAPTPLDAQNANRTTSVVQVMKTRRLVISRLSTRSRLSVHFKESDGANERIWKRIRENIKFR